MLPNSQFPADFVTFTEETLNGKFHFSCSGAHDHELEHFKMKFDEKSCYRAGSPHEENDFEIAAGMLNQ